ncbi:MAG: HipA domain-containing protein [Candidatus Aminicenantes bacterium]|nr:HipA domain-containing protein [Candidatus Aminicenantes bacterium]
MSLCFSCGKKITAQGDIHPACLRKLFGVDYLPAIDLSLQEISIKAQKMVGKLSISGVQPKLSLIFAKKNKKLEVTAEGGNYILKPQVQTFRNLPQNENLCMTIAARLNIDVPPHALVKLKDDSPAYIVKRFDRVKNKKIHQEDFFQALGKKGKYSGSLEQVGKKLREISRFPGLDAQFFFERVLLFFIIGNGDAHMKNFSVIYEDTGGIRLSPAYDIVSSKLVIPGEEDFALPMNEKKNNLSRGDFKKFSDYLDIPSKAYDNILARFSAGKSIIENLCLGSALEKEEKEIFLAIVNERYGRLLPLRTGSL